MLVKFQNDVKQESECKVSVTCMDCYLDGDLDHEITFEFPQKYSLASDMNVTVTLPYFFASNFIGVSSRVFPESKDVIFKGSETPTVIPLILTRTMYSQLPTDYLITSLFSNNRLTSTGYSIMRETIQKGTCVTADKVLTVEGLRVTIILRVNTYGFVIKQDPVMTLADAFSKISALAVLATAVCGLLLCIAEKTVCSKLFKIETANAISEVHAEFAPKHSDTIEMIKHDIHANEHASITNQ